LDDNYNTGNPFAELGQSLPTTPVFWPNGMPSSGVTAGSNPWVQASEQSGYSSNLTKRYSAKFSYNLQLPWWKSVSSEGYFVYTNNTTFGKNWNKPYLTISYSYATQVYSDVNGGTQKPTLSVSMSHHISRRYHALLLLITDT